MIRIGSLEDVALDMGAEQGVDEPAARSRPQVPEQRGSLQSSSTSS